MAAIRLDPSIRQQIKDSEASVKALACQYGVTEKTVRKWRNRADMDDRSHRTKRSDLILGAIQERVVCELRVLLQLSLDDLLSLTNALFDPGISRAALARRLTSHGVNQLKGLLSDDGRQLSESTPGTLLIIARPLPLRSESSQRRYLFIAIDVATHWIFAKTADDHTIFNFVDFLYHAQNAAPMAFKRVLTECHHPDIAQSEDDATDLDAGLAITAACREQGIAHSYYQQPSDQIGGDCSAFVPLLDKGLDRACFPTPESLDAAIQNLLSRYNEMIPQRTLGGQSPNSFLKNWGEKCPDDYYPEECRLALGNQGANLFLDLARLIGNSVTWSQYINLAKGIQDIFAPAERDIKKSEINKLKLFLWTKTIDAQKITNKPEDDHLIYSISHLIFKCPLKECIKPNLMVDFDVFIIFEHTKVRIFDYVFKRPRNQTPSFEKFKEVLENADAQVSSSFNHGASLTRTILLPAQRPDAPRRTYLKTIEEGLATEEVKNYFPGYRPLKKEWQVQFYHGKDVPPLFVEYQTIATARRWLYE